MLENLIWKNVFLPKFIKKEVVSFYESHYNNSNLKFHNKTLKSNLVHYLCHKIHKNWFNNQTHKPTHLLKDIYKYLNTIELPMSFWLLLAKTNKVHKLQKLLEWGFNLKKVCSINDMEMNVVQQIIWAYQQQLITLEETKEILDILIKENIPLFNSSYQISHYEKATALLKEDKLSFHHPLVINKKLIDTLYNWIDKDLYQYLIQSNLPENNKILLDFIYLKQKVHNVYMENFSGNIRRVGYGNLYKYMTGIEDVIKRQYIFKSQSAIYNTLALLFNLPEFTEKLNHHLILKCYDMFSHLKATAKRFLLADLVSKSKEVVLLNLLTATNKVNLNWKIKTEEGNNVLGLELLSNMDFIEHIIASDSFKINITNESGNNILHLIGSLPLEQERIKDKLKCKIEQLNELERTFLLNQYNENNLTPMLKAIEDENIQMIEFLLEIGVSGIEENKGVNKDYASPINYISKKLELLNFTSDICSVLNIKENHKEEWLYRLYKNWSIEKNYHNMQKKLGNTRKKQKVSKI